VLDSGIPSAFEQLKPFLWDGIKKAVEQATVVLSCDDTSDRQMIELEHFKEKAERIPEGKDREARVYRWKGTEEQLKGWRPDINDVVSINITP